MKHNYIKYAFALSVILITTFILFILLETRIESKESFKNYPYPDSGEVSFDDIFQDKVNFNIGGGTDLLVLLHIQKTGGTSFEKHLVQDLDIENPCECIEQRRRCICQRKSKNFNKEHNNSLSFNDTWLLSRFSTGWICGLHADRTQLLNCPIESFKRKRQFFATFLREPIVRFVSEFSHVQRGATWKNSRKHCDNYDTQICYKNKPNWHNVSLSEFLSCPQNTAINRQTRMLADHNLIKCSQDHENDLDLLTSAKENLKRMAFFGVCDEQLKSQFLFENTFKLKFKRNFQQSDDSKAKIILQKLTESEVKNIAALNYLDTQLYKYATDLFHNRIKQFNSSFSDEIKDL